MKLISEEKNALFFSLSPPSYIDQSTGMLITDHMSLIYPLGIIDNKDTGRDITNIDMSKPSNEQRPYWFIERFAFNSLSN